MSLRIGETIVGGGGDVSGKANIASPTFTGTVTAPTFSGALNGNASTATKAKNIPTTDEGGNIWIDGTIIDTNEITNVVTADTAGQCTGNSATATKWATARTLALLGDVTGSASIDGSGNVNLTASDVEVSSFGTTGYIKFRNGFIIQWGVTSAVSIAGGSWSQGATNGWTITFPSAFPNTCFYAGHVGVTTGAGHPIPYLSSLSNTTAVFHIQNHQDGSASNIAIRWIAIGY